MRREGERDDLLPALRALGDSLGEAARREIGADAAAPAAAAPAREHGARRRGLRGLGGRGGLLAAVAGVALVAAGAATAGDLISSGEPDRVPDDTPAEVRPPAGKANPIDLRAADAEAGGAWGLRLYRGAGGYACVTAGWIRGQSLGRVERGRFRAFPPDEPGTAGSCATVRPDGTTWAYARFDEPAARTLIFGRAGARVQRVEVFDGERRHVAPASRGAWLLVLDGTVDPLAVTVQAQRP